MLPCSRSGGDEVGEGRVVGRDEAAVAGGAEVLRRVERERRGVGEPADALAPDRRVDGLRRVLEHEDLPPPEGRADPVEVDRVAEEVDGHDRGGARRDVARDRRGVEVLRAGQDVGEDRTTARVDDRAGRREEREGRDDDLATVRREVVEDRAQRQVEGVGPRVDGDGARDAEVGRGLLLERVDLRALDERVLAEDAHERELGLGPPRRVHALGVHQRDAAGGGGGGHGIGSGGDRSFPVPGRGPKDRPWAAHRPRRSGDRPVSAARARPRAGGVPRATRA